MPTFSWLAAFGADFKKLTPSQQLAFIGSVKNFVEDLRNKKAFRKGLRVKGVKGAPGVFELTWADDGRATFQYGPQISSGESHVIWRRIGTHEILRRP
ncbi:MAG: hypothetical protein ACR2FO_05550 [Actinomycetota bacterium]